LDKEFSGIATNRESRIVNREYAHSVAAS